MKCLPCGVGFSTPGRLMHHAVTVHGASRSLVERTISQAYGGVVCIVGTRRGKVMLLIQPNLL